MAKGRGAEKDWTTIPIQKIDDYRDHLATQHVPSKVEEVINYAKANEDSCSTLPLTGKAAKRGALLRDCVIELKEPIVTDEVREQGVRGEPVSKLMKIEELIVSYRAARKVLRSAFDFQMTELYYLLTDSGSKERDAVTKIKELFREHQIKAISKGLAKTSWKRAMASTRTWFTLFTQQDYDRHRKDRASDTQKHNYEKASAALKAELVQRLQVMCILAEAFRRCENYEKCFRKTMNGNIKPDKLPSREVFISRFFNVPTPSPRHLLDMALHGHINPANLWLTVPFGEDFFDVVVFIGKRALGVHDVPAPDIIETCLHEIEGVAPQKPCDPETFQVRRGFAQDVLAYIKAHQLNDIWSELVDAAKA